MNKRIEDLRETLIKMLDESERDEITKFVLSNDLFNAGLNMYSGNNSIDSIVYNAFNSSIIDENISFHPEQIKALRNIINNSAVVISAPTSFGKTFCVFEYIARFKPKIVVLIVPTVALSREYILFFTKKHRAVFSNYHFHINIDEEMEYNFDEDNIFILTHDKATSQSNVSIIPKVDFLVVDEVYKLDNSSNEDRTLIFNVAYSILAKKAERYVLLAPFIKGIKNIDKLEKQPVFFSSNYAPVFNDVEDVDIDNDTPEKRYAICDHILETKCQLTKTLCYFPTPNDIEKYVRTITVSKENVQLSSDENEFLKWADNEFDPEWSVCIALRKGMLVNHGKMPIGVRDYLLSLFNDENARRSHLLCTSTLIEGVNTSAKALVIVKPSTKSIREGRGIPFRPFDFYNLVGRTGRLNRYYLGKTYYIKSNKDAEYKKEDAMVSISFELTEHTQDIDIQLNSSCNNPDVVDELKECGLTIDDFVNKIGSPVRFSTFKKIKKEYVTNKALLVDSLKQGNNINSFKLMNSIVKLEGDPGQYGVIKKILDSRHRRVKDVLKEIKGFESLRTYTTDQIIALILNIKNNYLEHKFLIRCKIVKMIMEKDSDTKDCADRIQSLFIRPIEDMYYLNVTYKKMLKNLGVYDSDIDTITNAIGTDYKDINELRERLETNKNKYYNVISFISKFAIDNLLN